MPRDGVIKRDIGRPHLRPVFVALASLMTFTTSQDISAQCDTNDFGNFRTRNRTANAAISPTTGATDQGMYSVSIPLSVGSGDAGLIPIDGGFSTTTTVPFNNWVWQLRADTRSGYDENDLNITYQMGSNNTMTSSADPSSSIDVLVSTRRIQVRSPGARNTRYRGFIDVFTDYTNATRAGTYTGVLTITIGCL